MPKRSGSARSMAKYARMDPGNGHPSCFVVMSFSGNAILETYFTEAVRPTLEKLGLECRRVDQESFTGRISDRIRDGIASSTVVLVDFTEDRPNCYFEAGYAEALGKPIVYQRLDAPRECNILSVIWVHPAGSLLDLG